MNKNALVQRKAAQLVCWESPFIPAATVLPGMQKLEGLNWPKIVSLQYL